MDAQPRLTSSHAEQYAQTLHRYVREESEDALAAAGEIGRDLMQSSVAPEELAEIHEFALRQLAVALPSLKLADAAPLLSAPLSEMLMAYGLAFREQAARQEAMETRLRQAEKMEAIGTFAAGIAHDFNNIVGAIIGFTEMSLDDVAPDGLARHNMQQVLRSAVRARDLVSQILAFSRQDEPRRMRVPCAAVVREAVSFIEASIPSTIELHTRLRAQAWIEADPIQLHQVVINLCANAIQAMEHGGVLEIELEDLHVRLVDEAPLPGLPAGDYVKLSVSDSGSGMSRDVMKRVFEPFFTTKPVGAGTGLGLSVVYGVVKSCGGTLSVASEPGRGARFDVYLPRAAACDEPALVQARQPVVALADRR